jgi:hypothetical protein
MWFLVPGKGYDHPPKAGAAQSLKMGGVTRRWLEVACLLGIICTAMGSGGDYFPANTKLRMHPAAHSPRMHCAASIHSPKQAETA